jgi:hypothetical protein
MWICLNDSFLSIVDKGDPSGATLLVRARREGDIARTFPEAVVEVGTGSDYPFRARLPRERVAARLAEALRDLRYPNFKSSVREPRRHRVYAELWAVLARDEDPLPR